MHGKNMSTILLYKWWGFKKNQKLDDNTIDLANKLTLQVMRIQGKPENRQQHDGQAI